MLKKLTAALADLADVEVHPKMEGYQMFTIFVPKKAKVAEKKPAEKKVEAAETDEPEKKPVKKAEPKPKAEPKTEDDEIF